MGEELAVAIRNAMFDGNYRPQIHVARRIAALMGNEAAEYTDVSHTPHDKSMKGLGIVLTATRVIYANWSTPNDHHGRTGTVVVTTWPRKSLIKAEIKAGGTNADQDWSQTSGSEWPYGGVLSLEYEGVQSPIELPLSQDAGTRSKFFELVPKLLTDLGK